MNILTNFRKTQIRSYTPAVRRQRLRIPVADLAQCRGVKVVQKTADLDAVLRQMGKPAQ